LVRVGIVIITARRRQADAYGLELQKDGGMARSYSGKFSVLWKVVVGCVALAVVFVLPAPDPVPASSALLPEQVAPGSVFLETFDGKPTNPQPWNARNWDVFQTSREWNSWANPYPVEAHHAYANCGDVAAGGSHMIDTWPETVFKCNDHVMTSINSGEGYAAVYLSPPAMADFTSQAATVSFDLSTFVASSRDWIDLLITPFSDAMSYPFRSDLGVDGSGLPANAIHIEQSFGSTQWNIEIVRNGAITKLGSLPIPYDAIGGPSKTVRTPVKVVVSTTS
jgi:hypothetical protein